MLKTETNINIIILQKHKSIFFLKIITFVRTFNINAMRFFLMISTLIIILMTEKKTCAQSPEILRGDPAYHTYDRMEILRMADTTMTNGINNYDRKRTINFFKNTWKNDYLTFKDRYDLRHAFSDNYEFLDRKSSGGFIKKAIDKLFKNEYKEANDNDNANADISQSAFHQQPILKYFYKTPANFWQVETSSFQMYVNPVVEINYLHQVNNPDIVFQNTRGIDVRGYIDEKVYFQTQLLENQRAFPYYTEDWIQEYKTIPGSGFYKRYQSGFIDNLKGYDYFQTKAYVGFNLSKSIAAELGHGSHFIGNGYRSLLLSDFSPNYFYLKFNNRVWKLHYQNLFAELAPISTVVNPGDRILPKKYTAMHYLAFKPSNHFEIGLFESVIFGRENHFELQYLNPIILYRAVEHSLDSPDNVLVGLNTKWNPIKGISLYGQLLLDEFKISEIKKQSGWWANKFGVQLGLKYMNVLGIDHLDLQAEYNVVRPYTYTHNDTLSAFPYYSVGSYSHYNQPLAHPLGANFKETIIILRYKPINRLYIQARGLNAVYGTDPKNQNWGGNILKPYTTRQQDYDNVIAQGIKTTVTAINLDISYEVFHNYFIDLKAMWRQTKVKEPIDQHYFGGGIRINLADVTYDY